MGQDDKMDKWTYNNINDTMKHKKWIEYLGSSSDIRDWLSQMYKYVLALLVIQEIMSNNLNLRGGPRLIPNKIINTNDEMCSK